MGRIFNQSQATSEGGNNTRSFRQSIQVSQEERSIFLDVTISVILSKNCICTCVLFGTVSGVEFFYCTVQKLSIIFFNLHIGGWTQGPLDTAAT
jgi:hypothetical protein